MAVLPHPWGAYLRLQAQLDDNTRIDDRNWGLEAWPQLHRGDGIGGAGISCDLDRDVARTISSEARRERNRKVIRRRLTPETTPVADPQAMIEARSHLRLVYSRLSTSEWDLLVNVAKGHQYDELGPSRALRVQVLRLRRKLAVAA